MRTRHRQRPVLTGRWGITALAFVSICAGALLLIPRLDLDDVLRDGINDEIERIAGEDLNLRGDAKVLIRPNFRVVVTDPIFASADGSDAEGLLTASRVEATLRIAPLLLGRGEIAKLDLFRPHISIDHIGAPTSLWSGTPGAHKSGTDVLKPPASITITDGTLEFAGEPGIFGLNLSILPGKASEGISISGDFMTGSRRTFVDLYLEDPPGFFSDGGSQGTMSFRFDAVETPLDTDPLGTETDSDLLADLRHLLDQVNVFGPGPLLVDGHFAILPGAIRVSNATISKGGIALQGNLDLRTTAEASILPQLQTLQVSADTAISDAVRAISSGNWPAAPITTSWLDDFEIDFDLEGQDIAFGGAAFDAVTISLHTRDDNLSLDVTAQSDMLGRLEARTAVDDAAEVTVSARVSDASLREIIQPISRTMHTRPFGKLQLPEGALNADLKLAGRGKTAGEILESLAGSVTASLENGRLTGADVTATLETLAQGRQFMTKEKGPLIPTAGRTRFDLIDGHVDIKAGTARISRLTIAGERLEINMLGEIGLKNGAMYVVGNAQLSAAREGETEQVARHVDLPFGIGGTVFSPMVAAGVPQFEVATTDTTAPYAQPRDTIRK